MIAEPESQYWNGIEEADWMMPHHRFIEALPLPETDQSELHLMLTDAYEHGIADGEDSVKVRADLARLLGGAS